jgi:hypothetical protein
MTMTIWWAKKEWVRYCGVTRSWELEEASKPCANELVGNYGLLIAIVEVRRKKEGEESW